MLERAAAQVPSSPDKPADAVLREMVSRGQKIPFRPSICCSPAARILGDDRDYTRDAVWGQGPISSVDNHQPGDAAGATAAAFR